MGQGLGRSAAEPGVAGIANCEGYITHVCWVVTGVSAVSEILHEKVEVNVVPLCLTLWHYIDYIVHGILQARKLGG